MSTSAHATPQVLRWAREAAGYDVPEAAQEAKLGGWIKLEAAEGGDDLLTLPELERVATAYGRDVAMFFMPEPPAEEPPTVLFRRLPGAPPLPWGPPMRLLARRVRERQDEIADLLDDLEEESVWASATKRWSRSLNRPSIAREAGAATRELLDVTVTASDQYAGLRAWIDAVEGHGVLVMQDGTMDSKTMRGFAATHLTVPIIVLNSTEDPRARTFTLLHEFGHLLLDRLALQVREPEAWCDAFAGEVLMPRAWIEQRLSSTSGQLLNVVDDLARERWVTPLAAATAISMAELLPPDDIWPVRKAIEARSRPRPWRPGDGGNPYLTRISRYGPSYVSHVFRALDTGALSYPAASGLLGLNVSKLGELRKVLASRTSRR